MHSSRVATDMSPVERALAMKTSAGMFFFFFFSMTKKKVGRKVFLLKTKNCLANSAQYHFLDKLWSVFKIGRQERFIENEAVISKPWAWRCSKLKLCSSEWRFIT